jgi:DNA-binding IclR family transcriptional regulator
VTSDDTRRALLAQFRARRSSGWRELARDIDAAIASVHEHGYCWASWQPRVVALATPLVMADHPVYVVNMSITADAEPAEVVERLREPLLALKRRLQEAISPL